jgi:hypothetical protein
MLLTVFVLLSAFLFYEYLEIQFRDIGKIPYCPELLSPAENAIVPEAEDFW